MHIRGCADTSLKVEDMPCMAVVASMWPYSGAFITCFCYVESMCLPCTPPPSSSKLLRCTTACSMIIAHRHNNNNRHLMCWHKCQTCVTQVFLPGQLLAVSMLRTCCDDPMKSDQATQLQMCSADLLILSVWTLDVSKQYSLEQSAV